MSTLPVFSSDRVRAVKVLLAGKVASMMGRKWEEGDWSQVYCRAMEIPEMRWSNLNIDVNFNGLGVEFKMLRVSTTGGRPIIDKCGTTLMHPSATRSIRIEDIDVHPDDAMRDIFAQYRDLIESHTEKVRAAHDDRNADMRTGWLLWESTLREFLYWEKRMFAPDASEYFAQWHERPAMGTRKASKSLWVFDRETKLKRYSVTTSAGIKIQPYFDVPPPDDPNLYHFRVQSESLDADTVVLWVSSWTAQELRARAGTTDKEVISNLILEASSSASEGEIGREDEQLEGVPIEVTREAFESLCEHWAGVNDDHCVRLFLSGIGGG